MATQIVHFPWQNPYLRLSIYPDREEKLRDFLAAYQEIDLWNQLKNSDRADAGIADRIRRSFAALRAEQGDLETRLSAALAEKEKQDALFGRITSSTPQGLNFKRKYYLDQQMRLLSEKRDERRQRRTTLLKRVEWYPVKDDRRQLWIDRAAELDEPIRELEEAVQKIRDLQTLLERREHLPELRSEESITVSDAVRLEVRQYREDLEKLDHEQLMESVVERFNRAPERFENWLRYMVIHFSGMRYQSAHASWADPRELLELLIGEDVREQVQQWTDAELVQERERALTALRSRRETGADPERRKEIDDVVARFQGSDIRRSLQSYLMEIKLAEIRALKDEQAVLQYLENYKLETEKAGDPLPDWVWDEIVKYTPLRLKTQSTDWERVDSERWKWENRRWREMLVTWEQSDITGWRQKHQQSLELVVTRAVCNEIAEHIQHLRGNTPGAGLTSKPFWYRNQAEKNALAYLKRAPAERDFCPGASILWLGWVDSQPNAWRVARPMGSDHLIPPGERLSGEGTRRRGVREKGEPEAWIYQLEGDTYTRRRRKPKPAELKAQGKTPEEIKAIMAERKTSGDFEKQYLRWTHDATVVCVEEMLDGKFVLTFETGKIGLILRRLRDLAGNPDVFVGYTPANPEQMQEMQAKLLEKMLNGELILPGKKIPLKLIEPAKQVRHQDARTDGASGGKTTQPSVGLPALVTVDRTNIMSFTRRGKGGRPAMTMDRSGQLFRGARLDLDSNHIESQTDPGNGQVFAANDQAYYRILRYERMPELEGKFISAERITQVGPEHQFEVRVTASKAVVQHFKTRDSQDKPTMVPFKSPGSNQAAIRFSKGDTLWVSSTHRESRHDAGDGIVFGQARRPYYLITACPAEPGAEGYFIQADEVARIGMEE